MTATAAESALQAIYLYSGSHPLHRADLNTIFARYGIPVFTREREDRDQWAREIREREARRVSEQQIAEARADCRDHSAVIGGVRVIIVNCDFLEKLLDDARDARNARAAVVEEGRTLLASMCGVRYWSRLSDADARTLAQAAHTIVNAFAEHFS